MPWMAWSQTPSETAAVLEAVVVQASAVSADALPAMTAPVKVLAGDELRDKLAGSLGDTLSRELGVSASGFGAAASRPIIRGQEGARVQVLQNGMGSGDVSALSNDHAVSTEFSTARQIEILRGPAALMYGSGASGGLVNIVNDKIAPELPDQLSVLTDVRVGGADNARSASVEMDAPSGPLALHMDASVRYADDYRIPGYRTLGGPATAWPPRGVTSQANVLPWSFSRREGVGLGASYIQSTGYTGVSFEQTQHRYGIPSFDGSTINQTQNRFNLEHMSLRPFEHVESFKAKLSYTDYQHKELETNGTPATRFLNQALDSRFEWVHTAWMGWRGTVGAQAGLTRFSASDLLNAGHAAIIPPTDSRNLAMFAVEEKRLGALKLDAGVRLERVTRGPNASTPYSDPGSVTTPAKPEVVERSFNLFSWSGAAWWSLAPSYSTGVTYSVAQRAPATEELYSFGTHDATVTFDVGHAGLQRETAHNLEWGLRKTQGLVRWQATVFHNQVHNYIYGYYPGTTETRDSVPYALRQFAQADVTLRGVEADITYNWRQPGWSARGFTDASRGVFDAGGSLPLQAATRFGLEGAYATGPWRTSVSLIHAWRQTRLAAFEVAPTPGYNQLDASLSYQQKFSSSDVTWFAQGRNLLNQDIRYSTTVEALRLYGPQPGRSLMLGARLAM
jgi:iron complex outermembrane receptor protein